MMPTRTLKGHYAGVTRPNISLHMLELFDAVLKTFPVGDLLVLLLFRSSILVQIVGLRSFQLQQFDSIGNPRVEDRFRFSVLRFLLLVLVGLPIFESTPAALRGVVARLAVVLA